CVQQQIRSNSQKSFRSNYSIHKQPTLKANTDTI
ncbi:unnamed protein product, partial [Rotaria magnacalcarata]